MFFLAVLTWATLATEPPKLIHFYKTLEECATEAQKQNLPSRFGDEAKVQYICLSLVGTV